MSTNFYLRGHTDSDDPEFHIGKRSGIGNGQCQFIWAMPKEKLLKHAKPKPKCSKCNREFPSDGFGGTDYVVENEYGDIYTLEEFKAVLLLCIKHDYDSVGSTFS